MACARAALMWPSLLCAKTGETKAVAASVKVTTASLRSPDRADLNIDFLVQKTMSCKNGCIPSHARPFELSCCDFFDAA
jgi:hypothetical protein